MNRTYKGYDIVMGIGGWGARPSGSTTMIGPPGTFQGYKSLKSLKQAITDDIAEALRVIREEIAAESVSLNMLLLLRQLRRYIHPDDPLRRWAE